MSTSDSSSDIVERLYETSIRPERLFDLIGEWDARINGGDPEVALQHGGLCDAPFARHIERALEILEEVNGFELRKLDDLLGGMPTAAMVLTGAGIVVAANEPARLAFGLFPGGSIRLMPLAPAELSDLAERVKAVALGPEPRDEIVRLRPAGRERPVLVHLKTLASGKSRRHALAVSTEHVWTEAVGDVLARVFSLTGAEIAVARLLTEGETVGDICRATDRSEGTVRSQLHAILTKTGARTQGELVRLASMLLQSAAVDLGRAEASEDPDALAPARRHIRLADGRKLAVLRFGDPAGRPVIWLQSPMGLHHPTTSGERELRRRKLRILVPIRAGYGTSDPAPHDRDILDVVVEDVVEVMRQAGIARCPFIAPMYEIRAALTLARAAPDRVERIVGVGCAFPIHNMEQLRRLNAVGRVFVACARFAPHMLPFLARAAHTRILRTGLDAYVRSVYREDPQDARIFSGREVENAVTAGYSYVQGSGPDAPGTFCAEVVPYQQKWPPGLGDVACPVILMQGEHDGTAPYATALDYCAMFPAWRCVGYPDAGQLVAYAHWNDLLALIEGGLIAEPPSLAPQLSLPAS